MAFTNEIHLSGRVFKDSEKRGAGPWRFTLVTGGRRKKDGSGYWPKEFFNCESWDTAQVKADQVVSVIGRLKHAEWTDAKTSEKKRNYVIVCGSVTVEEQKPPITPSAHGTDGIPW